MFIVRHTILEHHRKVSFCNFISTNAIFNLAKGHLKKKMAITCTICFSGAARWFSVGVWREREVVPMSPPWSRAKGLSPRALGGMPLWNSPPWHEAARCPGGSWAGAKGLCLSLKRNFWNVRLPNAWIDSLVPQPPSWLKLIVQEDTPCRFKCFRSSLTFLHWVRPPLCSEI